MRDHSRQREGSPPYPRQYRDSDGDNDRDNARRSPPRGRGDEHDIDYRRQQQSHHYGHPTHHDQYQSYRDDYRTRQGKDLIRTMPCGRRHTGT
ncbi:hypothetical protein ACRALDRAFT_1061025 [Sodiomyces alcalophilus JCM 7366]|uniref:uncharacterized protein n=1 Tax=Sodiomyces alcalophilus JCM 7366 TaxID=591952 RepID=UPI0039B5A2C5